MDEPTLVLPDTHSASPELPYGLSYGWAMPDPSEEPEDLWLRWPPHEPLAIRVVCDKALKYRAHWYTAARVYRLCGAPPDLRSPNKCPFCPRPASTGKPIAGPALWRHILTVELPCGQQRIWEFSEAVAEQLLAVTGYQRGPGGQETRTTEILGLRLLLRRQPPRLNGAVLVTADPNPDARGELPTPIPTADYVSQTWARAAIKDGKAPALPFR